MRKVYPASAALALLLLLPDPAPACSCMPDYKTYPQRRLEWAVIFHGQAVADQVDETRGVRLIRFAVIKDYSRDGSIVADTVTIWTGISDAACGYEVPVGEEALILADTSKNQPEFPVGALRTGSCSYNARGAGLQPALDQLEGVVGLPARRQRSASRIPRAQVDCGQILFGSKVQANGVLRSASGNR